MAFAAFLLFGLRDWAPYLLNGIWLFTLLLFFHWHLRPFAGWVRMACLAFVFTLPLAAMMTHEFRPDLPTALFTAMGVIQITMHRGRAGDAKTVLLAGVWFGLAMTSKPSFSPHTLMMLGATALVDALHRRHASPTDHSWFALFKSALKLGAVVGIILLPHYAAAWSNIAGYITGGMFGESASLWRPQGGVLHHLLYFLAGDGGKMMMGAHVYLLGAIVVLGVASHVVLRRKKSWDLLRLFCVSLCSYLFVSCNPTKNGFFGSTFQILWIFIAVTWLARLLEGGPNPRATVVLRTGGLVLLFWAATLWVPLHSYNAVLPPRDQLDAFHNVYEKILDAIEENAGEEESTVFFVTTGFIAAPTLQWIAAKRHLSLACTDLHVSQHFDPIRDQMDHSRFIVVPDAGADGVGMGLPSAGFSTQALEHLRQKPNSIQLTHIPCLGREGYNLFQNDLSGATTP